MAHFALLDENNIVTHVLVGRDEDTEQDLFDRTGQVYKKTSYNTKNGVHYDSLSNLPDNKPQFRFNYAGIGYFYDQDRDAFIPPKIYNSWALNEQTCNWDAPIAYPQDGDSYQWDENTISWVKIN